VSDDEKLKQQIVMRQVMRVGEIVSHQSADSPEDHTWEELDSLIHDVQFSLLGMWGYSTIEELMGPQPAEATHEMKTREAAEWMIEQDYLKREWRINPETNKHEEFWVITESGKDYYATLQEHREDDE
jgi:hypothetical protein